MYNEPQSGCPYMFNRILKVALCSAVILTTYGCQSTSENGNLSSIRGTDPYALLQQAQSTSSNRQRARLRLAAARLFAEENDPVSVLEVLSLVDQQARLSSEEMDAVFRLRADAHMQLGAPELASDALRNLADWQGKDFLSLSRICQAMKEAQCAADALIQASMAFGYTSPELPVGIHDRIWAALSLARQGPQVFTHRYHHAWWLLQQTQRAAGSIPARVEAWQRFKRSNPSHPAVIDPPTQLNQLESYETPSIAVALPLSGPYAMAGKAARDGFIAAYLNELSSGTGNLMDGVPGANLPSESPIVQFYDTERTELSVIWRKMLDSGATVIVGPLIKDKVETFSFLTRESPLPRLVLNYIDDPQTIGPQQQFQLGIAIEDEAISLAQHVATQGHKNLLVVHSTANWALRAQSAFAEQWSENATLAGFADIKELTEAVGSSMQVASSTVRQQELVRILGQTLEFLPRARGDLDGIVALTTNVESRALVPALKFHFADHLPIYATSQAVRNGPTDAIKRFTVTDMPLFASPGYQHLRDVLNPAQSRFSELYALGFDAYRVATWLPLTQASGSLSLPGASGYLWMEGDGVFHRELEMQQVRKAQTDRNNSTGH